MTATRRSFLENVSFYFEQTAALTRHPEGRSDGD